MKNNLAKARDDERAFQAHLAKREKEAKDFYLAGAEECLARIEKLRGVNAKKDLAEWFDRCRLWLLLTKNDRQVKSLANENRKKISTATRTLLKAIHETGLDALAELLGGDDAADDFVATLHLARKRLTAPRRRGPKRDEGRDAFGMALKELFKAHNIKFTASASGSNGPTSLAVACYKAGLKAHSADSARKDVQRLGSKTGKS